MNTKRLPSETKKEQWSSLNILPPRENGNDKWSKQVVLKTDVDTYFIATYNFDTNSWCKVQGANRRDLGYDSRIHTECKWKIIE